MPSPRPLSGTSTVLPTEDERPAQNCAFIHVLAVSEHHRRTTLVRLPVTGACCAAESRLRTRYEVELRMRAYVLVNARPGRSLELAQGLRDVQGVQVADAITGEYDI